MRTKGLEIIIYSGLLEMVSFGLIFGSDLNIEWFSPGFHLLTMNMLHTPLERWYLTVIVHGMATQDVRDIKNLQIGYSYYRARL